MDQSAFTDPEITPDEREIEKVLGNTYSFWKEICSYVMSIDHRLENGWYFSSPKYGWSYRIKDKKRTIIYLLPRKGFFKVALVFGQKATDKVLASDVSEAIKTELSAARVYTEGRGIRIEVRNEAYVRDIFKLVEIKMEV